MEQTFNDIKDQCILVLTACTQTKRLHLVLVTPSHYQHPGTGSNALRSCI